MSKNTNDLNNILDVKRRAVAAKAVQFTGKNGGEVAAFVRENGEAARNGGTYVSVTTDASAYRATKGDWVVLDADGHCVVYSPDDFAKLFLIKGKK